MRIIAEDLGLDPGSIPVACGYGIRAKILQFGLILTMTANICLITINETVSFILVPMTI